ncbi:EamA family transporter RarD [Solimonas sp. K1W22B-7]|uniref:EamA family transporter RarD n=1 Tax=Solimonas sp. K1W22B-7 TaxID=2303331 RepID=UPI000E32E7D9|nr:EamA family transporter RarD [Solimonas sp. K1W22B-7]
MNAPSPTADRMDQTRKGLAAALGAYLIWGLFPLYWKLLATVPAVQTMAHRTVWCALLVALWLGFREGYGWLRELPRRTVGMLLISALLIACNWWLYIWAVTAGHIVETSLGYFINPLLSVLLGVFVLRERLRPLQWLAVAIAAIGVIYMTLQAGRLPWIALAIAASFGGYGLWRKLMPVSAVQGLAVESGLLFLPALIALLWFEHKGSGTFGHHGLHTDLLLAFGGFVTALPLVWFAYGARRIPLSTVGLLQYITPTLQLMCGVLVFHEPFLPMHWVGFGLIWSALAVYAMEGLWRMRRGTAQPGIP